MCYRNVICVAVLATLIVCATNAVGQPGKAGDKKTPFRSAQGRFDVLIPGTPKQDSQSFKKGDEELVKHRFAVFRNDRSELFMVIYMDLPANTLKEFGADKLLDLFTDGIVTDAKGKLREKRAIRLAGTAGWEIKVDIPNTGTMKARVFLVGNRCYHVIAGMPGDKEASSQEVREFLDSFRILK